MLDDHAAGPYSLFPTVEGNELCGEWVARFKPEDCPHEAAVSKPQPGSGNGYIVECWHCRFSISTTNPTAGMDPVQYLVELQRPLL